MREGFELLSVDQKTFLHGYHWSCPTPWAVLQISHGMAEHILRYDELATYLNTLGIAVIGHDHLGHGKSIQQQPQGYFHDDKTTFGLIKDLYQVTGWGKNRYPDLPLFILGHSMGSFVLRNYIFDHGSEIDGAILMGTGQQPIWLTQIGRQTAGFLSHFQGETHHSKLIDRIAFGNMNRKISNRRTDKDWLSSVPEEVDAYLGDHNCGFLFTLNGYRELFSMIIQSQDSEKMKHVPKELPLLFLSGKDDPVGDFGKGVMKAAQAYQKAGSTKVTVKLYENARHEIVNERQKQIVFRDICKWMEKFSDK